MKKYFSSLIKNSFKKEFWKFTLESDSKSWRLLFTILFSLLGIVYSLQSDNIIFGLIGIILLNILNIAQFHDTYYKSR